MLAEKDSEKKASAQKALHERRVHVRSGILVEKKN